MNADSSTLNQLPRAECLRLAGQVPLGRIVYTRSALPAVALVNFALHEGDIIIRTDSGGKLAAATRGAVVAFETDSVDPATHEGWSVTCVGCARAVTDAGEADGLRRLGLACWAPGRRDHFIRITPTIVTGQRLGGPKVPANPSIGPCR